jgi:hypothetical protein
MLAGTEEKEFAMVIRELGLYFVEVVSVVVGCFVEVVRAEGCGSYGLA